jgi:hypothetical protein
MLWLHLHIYYTDQLLKKVKSIDFTCYTGYGSLWRLDEVYSYWSAMKDLIRRHISDTSLKILFRLGGALGAGFLTLCYKILLHDFSWRYISHKK